MLPQNTTNIRFLVFLIILIFIASVLLFTNRFEIESAGPQNALVYKLDHWTGKIWIQQYYDDTSKGRVWYWKETFEIK